MKILLILALAALLVGCVGTVPEETIPYKPDPVTETVPEAEEIPAIDLDTPYTGEMFYYSQLSDSENGKPIDTYTAQAVLAFDFSAHPDWYGGDPAIKSYRDEIPSYESTSYPRMTKDRVIYPLDEENFKSPMGYTADGMPFVWETAEYRHPSTDEIGTQYITSIQIDDASMVQASFYGYSFDKDFETSVLMPLLTSCRTWTPDTPLTIRFTTNSDYQDEPSSNYCIDLSLPDLWEWDSSIIAVDMKMMYTKRYATKRMEIQPITYAEPFKGFEDLQSQGIPDPITGTTDEGLPYEIYAYSGFSEGEPLEVTWYFANIGYDSRYIQISFLTFEDDPEDYFETVTLPVIRSVQIKAAE